MGIIYASKTPINENGKRHGLWEIAYVGHGLHYKGCYINGLCEGYHIEYYKSGRIKYHGCYVNDKCHGYWETYDECGNLKIRNYFKGNFLYKTNNCKLIL